MFIDYAQIIVKAGDGGSGCVAFRREKFVPKGGPSGGDGGDGGNIVVVADRNIHTLLDFRYQRHYKAQRGQHGQGDNKTGKSGEDTIIRLPVGTLVKDAETQEILADLVRDGQRAIIAKGGRGGRGNARFASPTNRTPREWEVGGKGEERVIDLELKLLADVGLVGLPNAGKSTLLSRISAARPKIASYPFTTLQPNLGLVKVDAGKSFVAADIPGLIEGAHTGKGLGIQFLRHIERTRVLALLLDVTSEHLEEDYRVLLEELKSYEHELETKPRLIVYTKSDLLSDNFTPLSKDVIGNAQSITISAIKGENLKELIHILWEMVRRENQDEEILKDESF